jgi:uncharacterized membrane protein YkoI
MAQHSNARTKWRTRAGRVVPALLIALALDAQAMARPDPDSDRNRVPRQEMRQPSRALAGQSQDRVIAIAEKRHGAKVIKVEEGSHKGRPIYVLRLLSKEGKVSTVRVDAENGRDL